MHEVGQVPEMGKPGTGIFYSRDQVLLQSVFLADMVLLYFTLLVDEVVLGGFLPEFVSLESSMRHSSERRIRMAANLTDNEAERLLVTEKERKLHGKFISSSMVDQLVVAADIKPRRFRTKWQKSCYEGPTARQDAESAERSRWINLLADLLRNTDTPMERSLRENPVNSQLMGGGRRAGTPRSRVRSIQKFIAWLAVAHRLSFCVRWRQLIEYAEARLSEPCVRGSLKLLHNTYLFPQEVAGIQDDGALHEVTRKELVASAIPGKTPRQAPRFPTIILAALEDSVMSPDAPTYWRVMSWWLLLQCWATLSFDDHRGIVPSELQVTESGLLGKLTRSKVSGPDKKLNFRLLVIHSSTYVHQKLWRLTGWRLLEKEAPYSRDNLLPAPSNNYRGFKNKEMKYKMAFAVQTRILAFAAYGGSKIFFGRAQGTTSRPIAGGTLCQQRLLF